MADIIVDHQADDCAEINETYTVDQSTGPVQFTFSGDGQVTVCLDDIPLTTLNSSNNIYEAKAEGTYTFKSFAVCKNVLVCVSPLLLSSETEQPPQVDVDEEYICDEDTDTWQRIVTVYIDGVEDSQTVTDTGIPCSEPPPTDIEFITKEIELCNDDGTWCVLLVFDPSSTDDPPVPINTIYVNPQGQVVTDPGDLVPCESFEFPVDVCNKSQDLTLNPIDFCSPTQATLSLIRGLSGGSNDVRPATAAQIEQFNSNQVQINNELDEPLIDLADSLLRLIIAPVSIQFPDCYDPAATVDLEFNFQGTNVIGPNTPSDGTGDGGINVINPNDPTVSAFYSAPVEIPNGNGGAFNVTVSATVTVQQIIDGEVAVGLGLQTQDGAGGLGTGISWDGVTSLSVTNVVASLCEDEENIRVSLSECTLDSLDEIFNKKEIQDDEETTFIPFQLACATEVIGGLPVTTCDAVVQNYGLLAGDYISELLDNSSPIFTWQITTNTSAQQDEIEALYTQTQLPNTRALELIPAVPGLQFDFHEGMFTSYTRISPTVGEYVIDLSPANDTPPNSIDLTCNYTEPDYQATIDTLLASWSGLVNGDQPNTTDFTFDVTTFVVTTEITGGSTIKTPLKAVQTNQGMKYYVIDNQGVESEFVNNGNQVITLGACKESERKEFQGIFTIGEDLCVPATYWMRDGMIECFIRTDIFPPVEVTDLSTVSVGDPCDCTCPDCGPCTETKVLQCFRTPNPAICFARSSEAWGVPQAFSGDYGRSMLLVGDSVAGAPPPIPLNAVIDVQYIQPNGPGFPNINSTFTNYNSVGIDSLTNTVWAIRTTIQILTGSPLAIEIISLPCDGSEGETIHQDIISFIDNIGLNSWPFAGDVNICENKFVFGNARWMVTGVHSSDLMSIDINNPTNPPINESYDLHTGTDAATEPSNNDIWFGADGTLYNYIGATSSGNNIYISDNTGNTLHEADNGCTALGGGSLAFNGTDFLISVSANSPTNLGEIINFSDCSTWLSNTGQPYESDYPIYSNTDMAMASNAFLYEKFCFDSATEAYEDRNSAAIDPAALGWEQVPDGELCGLCFVEPDDFECTSCGE